MSGLKLLFDTNVFYACEDISPTRLHVNAELATRLKQLALQSNCELFLHPATKSDIGNTESIPMRQASLLKMRQWRLLAPFDARSGLAKEAGYATPLSPNDEVDLQMLASLDNNATDFLITEDRRLRNHVVRAGLGDRALSILGGIEYLERFLGESTVLPTVEERVGYQLSVDDPFFDSLKLDYAPFESWFREKVQRKSRPCRVVFGANGEIEALAILKIESGREHDLAGKLLKVCTFKVAPQAGGAKRGELILKSVFQFAQENGIDQIYVEVFPHHVGVVRLFSDFGFHELDGRTQDGQLVLAKNRRPPPESSQLDPLQFHRDFGPPAVLVRRAFVVPIQPQWHDVLFPEARIQGQLFGPNASGNAIMKAYLSRSLITTLAPGDTLLFYRSIDLSAITVIGVVESVTRSSNADEIRRLVGLRTVYPDAEIRLMCEDDRSVLAILFRQDRVLPAPWPLRQLKKTRLLKGPPQTIQRVNDEGALTWLRQQLNAPR